MGESDQGCMPEEDSRITRLVQCKHWTANWCIDVKCLAYKDPRPNRKGNRRNDSQ